MSQPKPVVVPAVGDRFRVRIGAFVFDRVFRTEAAARAFAAKVSVKKPA